MNYSVDQTDLKQKVFQLFSSVYPYLPNFKNIIILDVFPVLTTTSLPCLRFIAAMLFPSFISRREARDFHAVLAESPVAAQQQML